MCRAWGRAGEMEPNLFPLTCAGTARPLHVLGSLAGLWTCESGLIVAIPDLRFCLALVLVSLEASWSMVLAMQESCFPDVLLVC